MVGLHLHVIAVRGGLPEQPALKPQWNFDEADGGHSFSAARTQRAPHELTIDELTIEHASFATLRRPPCLPTP